MLFVDQEAVVGRGSHRVCYRHPENEGLCVKVEYVANTKASIREKRYYALLKKRHYSWRLIPKHHGTVQTDLGQAEVFDLVRDYHGQVSSTLSHYLAQRTFLNSRRLREAFYEFKHKLLSDALNTHKLHPDNIVVRDDKDRYTLLIIDDLGNSEFLPISSYLRYFAAKKIRRRWARFEKLLNAKFPEHPCLAPLDDATRMDIPSRTHYRPFFHEPEPSPSAIE